ncbi:MAG TPA: AraC family transcriptional regulator [Gammaproteobacteria bacterium]|jgi:AraC family transcriptional regulator
MKQEFSGATVRRTIDCSGAEVPEHAHDWPLLSLFVIGAYSNHTELGDRHIAGPSAVLYAAGAAHRNQAGADGFEQIEIEFDPAWLGYRLPENPISCWIGGQSSVAAHGLASLCSRDVTEETLRGALQHFLERASPGADIRRPEWLEGITQNLKADPTRKVSALAAEAGLHPSWLGTAYRRIAGESLLDAAARFRIEHATRLLRETDAPFLRIAMEAGFCDQSHMIRTFRRVLGRLPSAVREDRKFFRQS